MEMLIAFKEESNRTLGTFIRNVTPNLLIVDQHEGMASFCIHSGKKRVR